jgi:hypothetical protein
MSAKGVLFSMPPRKQYFGRVLVIASPGASRRRRTIARCLLAHAAMCSFESTNCSFHRIAEVRCGDAIKYRDGDETQCVEIMPGQFNLDA